MTNALIPVNDIEKMANSLVKSRLFGMKTVEEAMALMFIAQGEGYHPAIAAKEYHIIQGRPSLKADAMLARFQAAGGKVQWNEITDSVVSGTFSHAQGGSVKIEWDTARAKKAGLDGKDNWKKYPRQMLRSRVISEGVRTVFPGVTSGVYTPEESADKDFLTIDGEATEVTNNVEAFSIHPPEGPSQAEKKAMYAEAEEALDAVIDLDDLQSWQDKWHSKLSRLIAKAHMTKLDDKAFRIQQTFLNKQNEVVI